MFSLVKYLVYLLLTLFVFSCNTSEKKFSVDKTTQKTYNYTLDTSGIKVLWTAYKFTEKVGISGKFDSIIYFYDKSAPSIQALLKSSEISICTNSVNSYNAIRDPKLKQTFFKSFNTDTIRGKIIEVEDEKGLLALQMNSINNLTSYSYNYKNDTLTISTHLDLTKWDGKIALDTLNKECYDLHIGPDGISKLWPDVAVKIKLPIKRRISL
ncbi:YceI family protein [uncultured Winogradskyella sp.]|uniref:YceI family protein n=1 Tax=uncultured Winogradskyella sp. TaxID=395353 RepID=UPI00262D7B27|nr:YceI family protein [uncultured Winogradskyella sp.]